MWINSVNNTNNTSTVFTFKDNNNDTDFGLLVENTINFLDKVNDKDLIKKYFETLFHFNYDRFIYVNLLVSIITRKNGNIELIKLLNSILFEPKQPHFIERSRYAFSISNLNIYDIPNNTNLLELISDTKIFYTHQKTRDDNKFLNEILINELLLNPKNNKLLILALQIGDDVTTDNRIFSNKIIKKELIKFFIKGEFFMFDLDCAKEYLRYNLNFILNTDILKFPSNSQINSLISSFSNDTFNSVSVFNSVTFSSREDNSISRYSFTKEIPEHEKQEKIIKMFQYFGIEKSKELLSSFLSRRYDEIFINLYIFFKFLPSEIFIECVRNSITDWNKEKVISFLLDILTKCFNEEEKDSIINIVDFISKEKGKEEKEEVKTIMSLSFSSFSTSLSYTFSKFLINGISLNLEQRKKLLNNEYLMSFITDYDLLFKKLKFKEITSTNLVSEQIKNEIFKMREDFLIAVRVIMYGIINQKIPNFKSSFWFGNMVRIMNSQVLRNDYDEEIQNAMSDLMNLSNLIF